MFHKTAKTRMGKELHSGQECVNTPGRSCILQLRDNVDALQRIPEERALRWEVRKGQEHLSCCSLLYFYLYSDNGLKCVQHDQERLWYHLSRSTVVVYSSAAVWLVFGFPPSSRKKQILRFLYIIDKSNILIPDSAMTVLFIVPCFSWCHTALSLSFILVGTWRKSLHRCCYPPTRVLKRWKESVTRLFGFCFFYSWRGRWLAFVLDGGCSFNHSKPFFTLWGMWIIFLKSTYSTLCITVHARLCHSFLLLLAKHEIISLSLSLSRHHACFAFFSPPRSRIYVLYYIHYRLITWPREVGHAIKDGSKSFPRPMNV
jgi:hypothetical protein